MIWEMEAESLVMISSTTLAVVWLGIWNYVHSSRSIALAQLTTNTNELKILTLLVAHLKQPCNLPCENFSFWKKQKNISKALRIYARSVPTFEGKVRWEIMAAPPIHASFP